ncbi:MAG TPA: sulfite exporter TauE/SafE family protein, partial [Thermaerobacter sp.]
MGLRRLPAAGTAPAEQDRRSRWDHRSRAAPRGRRDHRRRAAPRGRRDRRSRAAPRGRRDRRRRASGGWGGGGVGFPWAALVAAATGILSGLSIGGGSVLVPALVLLLNVPQPVAQGVVLATFPAVALVAAWIHWRHGFLRWRLALRVTAGSAAGAWLGAQLGTSAPEELLRR